MHNRRFTRLTNAFSKKVENRAYSVALFTTYYNFVRINKTLRVTPAWPGRLGSALGIADIIASVEAAGVNPGKRGLYRMANTA
jgi:hypothetical protein